MVNEQVKEHTKSEMIAKVKKYPITKGMKLKIIYFMEMHNYL